jgi:N-acetylmuramoyl-L-alanine amidase
MMSPKPRIEQRPSANFGPRAAGVPLDILILHYTGMRSAESALVWLTDPASEASAHYLVDEAGRIARLVDESERAWHAGDSSWGGERDVNSRSIGIEIANPGHDLGYREFPGAQIDAVIGLCRDILSRHPIPPRRVLAHSDVAPRRKQDPGELFPWARLHAEGIGHWVPPEPVGDGQVLRPGDGGGAVADLRKRFGQYGYGLDPGDEFDAATEAVVTAFQRHFRPARVDGIADASTVATLDRLIAALA